MLDYRVPRLLQPWWRPWTGPLLGLLGFAYATIGFFNVWFGWGLSTRYFNQHNEIVVIVVYGLALLPAIRERYQQVRMAVMVSLLFTFWYLIPTYWPFNVDLFGARTGNTFPSWDVPGTWTNLALFGAALLFGRRVKCGWMNTCVALKETAGAPFRCRTVRGPTAHKLRRLKLLTGSTYLCYFVAINLPASSAREAFLRLFWSAVVVVYFGSLYLSPLWGNRVWCRFICPIFFGWANVIGFFRLRVDRSRCNDCGACEKVCDFGLPIRALSRKSPKIRTTECMGCGRCRSICSKNAISYYDVRHYLLERVVGRYGSNTRPRCRR